MSDLKRRLIRVLLVVVENNILENFDTESFDGEKWQPRTSRDKSDRRTGKNRALLIKTGRLRRSLRVEITNNGVKVSSSVPYASIHNRGGRVGRRGTATMPKRQFVGVSKKLNDDINTSFSLVLREYFSKKL